MEGAKFKEQSPNQAFSSKVNKLKLHTGQMEVATNLCNLLSQADISGVNADDLKYSNL